MPLHVGRDSTLSLSDVKVYMMLDYLCGKRGWWYGPHHDIAERLDISTRSVERSVSKLVEAGHIATKRLGMRFRTWTMYHVLARTVDAPIEPTSEIDRPASLADSDPTEMADPIPQTTPQKEEEDDGVAARVNQWNMLTTGFDRQTTPTVSNPQGYFKKAKDVPQLDGEGLASWRRFINGIDASRREFVKGAVEIHVHPLRIPTLAGVRKLLPVAEHLLERRRRPTPYEIMQSLQRIGIPITQDAHDALEVIAERPRVFMANLDEIQGNDTEGESDG
jgi:hypothetical protein